MKKNFEDLKPLIEDLKPFILDLLQEKNEMDIPAIAEHYRNNNELTEEEANACNQSGENRLHNAIGLAMDSLKEMGWIERCVCSYAGGKRTLRRGGFGDR